MSRLGLAFDEDQKEFQRLRQLDVVPKRGVQRDRPAIMPRKLDLTANFTVPDLEQ